MLSSFFADLVDQFTTELSAFEQQIGQKKTDELSFDAVMNPLDRISRRLSEGWGVVGHLNSVKNSEALRGVVTKMQPRIVAASSRYSQSEALYSTFKKLKEGPFWSKADTCQKVNRRMGCI
jgi:oligopeptidase A